MNRTEIEIKLNQERAWTLETWAAMPQDDLTRSLTTSKRDPEASWSAKDHLAHRGKSFSEVVALGQKIRGETLALLAELSDELYELYELSSPEGGDDSNTQ